MTKVKATNRKKNVLTPRGIDVRLGEIHSRRWRRVSTLFPRLVGEVYGGDIERALGDSDAQVVAKVAAWEREHGLKPKDWHGIGLNEAHPSDKFYKHMREIAKAAKRYRGLKPLPD